MWTPTRNTARSLSRYNYSTYRQAVTLEMGPTELLPGSHFLYSEGSLLGHYDRIKGTVKAIGPAGSIYMDVYNIWHRRMPSTYPGRRDMLKYTCWRTSAPERDWTIDPDFDIATADFRIETLPVGTGTLDCRKSAEMFFWLLGRSEELHVMGGTLLAHVRGFHRQGILGARRAASLGALGWASRSRRCRLNLTWWPVSPNLSLAANRGVIPRLSMEQAPLWQAEALPR